MSIGKHWKPDEDEALRGAWGKVEREKLPGILPGRNLASIISRASHLCLPPAYKRGGREKAPAGRLPETRAGRHWTTNELTILQNMVDDGATAPSLILEFKRPLEEIIDEGERIALDMAPYKGGERIDVPPHCRQGITIEIPIDIMLRVKVREVKEGA